MFLTQVTLVSDDATTALVWYGLVIDQNKPVRFVALAWLVDNPLQKDYILLDEWHISQYYIHSGTLLQYDMGCSAVWHTAGRVND